MPYLPSAETIFASTSPTSQTVFSEFLPFAYMALGFIVGALIVAFLIYELPGLVMGWRFNRFERVHGQHPFNLRRFFDEHDW